MAKTFQATVVHNDLRPIYYDQFQCLMGNCHLSCCNEPWHITFNKQDYLTLKHVSGSPDLNARLQHGLIRIRKGYFADQFYGEFNMSSGACPLLRESGLCALQEEKGTRVQPKVCHIFPRVEEVSAFGYYERALSPACESVLALLWELTEGVSFLSDPLPTARAKDLSVPQSSRFSAAQLQEIRSICIDLLQARQFPLPHRILLMGIALKELANGETDLPRWISETQATLSDSGAAERLAELFHDPGQRSRAQALLHNFHLLLSVQTLNQEFSEIRADIAAALGMPLVSGSKITFSGASSVSLPLYHTIRSRYEKCFGAKAHFMENLMVSIFFQLHLPHFTSPEELWRSYVNFCNLYSFYQFIAVMSCRETAAGDRDELFRLIVHVSRVLLHNNMQRAMLRDELFQHDSATLAHMAVLLSV